MARTLELYFDFISPYAYLAWTQIHRLADAHGAVVAPRPILFAALLDANQTKGPAEIPAKRVSEACWREACNGGRSQQRPRLTSIFRTDAT